MLQRHVAVGIVMREIINKNNYKGLYIRLEELERIHFQRCGKENLKSMFFKVCVP